MKRKLPWWMPWQVIVVTICAGIAMLIVVSCEGGVSSWDRPDSKRMNVGGVDCVIVWKDSAAGVDCNWPNG